MPIIEFLAARLAEDETAARAATPGPWSHNPGKMWLPGESFIRWETARGEEFVGYGTSPYRGCIAATGQASDHEAMCNARHIARHDPSRVLADVAARRQMLARCQTALASGEPQLVCFAEQMLRDLAQPYADHPDYLKYLRP